MPPKLVCLTPVCNEAWILDTFLSCTSLWADIIIIADQNSTDESREIALKYPKVKLIVNKSLGFNEPERQKMLIDEARKIEGSKILFALDADEIFTANFSRTKDWQRILNSKPGEVFGFQWANITPEKNTYFLTDFYFPWVIHDDGTEHKNYVRFIHSMRIPYPIEANQGYFKVNDFKVFHFAFVDPLRVDSKNKFYQCLVKVNEPEENIVSLYRTYHLPKQNTTYIPNDWLEEYNKKGIDILNSAKIPLPEYWYDNKVIAFFKEHGFKKFETLDIWDKAWIDRMKSQVIIKDPRAVFIKAIHFYLRISNEFSKTFIIRGLDKALKILSKLF